MWDQKEAVELCKLIESGCTKYGCHVALTGGLLYKNGTRKDCDILFYCIRQVDNIEMHGLLSWLSSVGVESVAQKGWVIKAVYKGKSVDMFFPEEFPSSSENLAHGEY